MFIKGHSPYHGPGRPKGSQNKITTEAKQLARGLLNDPTYRKNLQARLLAGEAGAMEPLLWAYAFGKPKEHIEMNWNLEKLTETELDQLEAMVRRIG
jgi:hypothetical protein